MKPPTNDSARVAAGVSEPQSEAKRAKHSTNRSAAREQFRKAKRAYDAAIIACPAGDPHAEIACDEALRGLNEARAALREAGERG